MAFTACLNCFTRMKFWHFLPLTAPHHPLQLNIFSARLASTKPSSTILGYAYSPWDVQNNVVHDGVFINDRTLPGGTAVSGSVVYNKGIVTIHEVGWFCCFLTFLGKNSKCTDYIRSCMRNLLCITTRVQSKPAHQAQAMLQVLMFVLLFNQVGHWLGLMHVFAGGCDATTGGDFVADTRAAAAADYQCTSQNTCPNLPGTNPIHNYMGELMAYFARYSGIVCLSCCPQTLPRKLCHNSSWTLADIAHLEQVSCGLRRLYGRRVPIGLHRRPGLAHPADVADVPRQRGDGRDQFRCGDVKEPVVQPGSRRQGRGNDGADSGANAKAHRGCAAAAKANSEADSQAHAQAHDQAHAQTHAQGCAKANGKEGGCNSMSAQRQRVCPYMPCLWSIAFLGTY